MKKSAIVMRHGGEGGIMTTTTLCDRHRFDTTGCALSCITHLTDVVVAARGQAPPGC
jgi:hypothetical protein